MGKGNAAWVTADCWSTRSVAWPLQLFSNYRHFVRGMVAFANGFPRCKIASCGARASVVVTSKKERWTLFSPRGGPSDPVSCADAYTLSARHVAAKCSVAFDLFHATPTTQLATKESNKQLTLQSLGQGWGMHNLTSVRCFSHSWPSFSMSRVLVDFPIRPSSRGLFLLGFRVHCSSLYFFFRGLSHSEAHGDHSDHGDTYTQDESEV